MLDLTGAPTETIWMDHPNFDSEITWARLLSFKQEGFPMGCASAYGYVEKGIRFFGYESLSTAGSCV